VTSAEGAAAGDAVAPVLDVTAAAATAAAAAAAAAFLLLRLLLLLLLLPRLLLPLWWRLLWLLWEELIAASYVPGLRGRRSITSTVTLSRVPRSSAALVSAFADRLTAATPAWPDCWAACVAHDTAQAAVRHREHM